MEISIKTFGRGVIAVDKYDCDISEINGEPCKLVKFEVTTINPEPYVHRVTLVVRESLSDKELEDAKRELRDSYGDNLLHIEEL